MITVQVQCIKCKSIIDLQVEEKDLKEYKDSKSRRLIQEIFPYLSPAERELLISGYCGHCWSNLFMFRG